MKKRLIGAGVLILLAVIFVPMLLPDGSPPGSNPAGVSIPSQPDQALQTRVLKVGPDSASAGPDAQAAIHDPDRVATLDLDKQAAAATQSSEPAASAAQAPTEPSAPAGSAPAASAPAVRAPAATTGTPPEPKPVAGGAGAAATAQYAVNLGIYADHASAARLAATAKQHGMPATTTAEDFQGKPVLRVRVGPYPSRAAAEAARLKLQAFEPVASMTVEAMTRDQSGDAPTSALAVGQAGAWAVQLAAFSDQGSADKLRDRLRSQGFDGFVDSVKTSSGTLWRVRAGPFATRGGAEAARTKIADRIKIKGNIVTQ